MNKMLLVPSLLLASNVALADTVFGVYAGGGSWNTAYSGDLGVSDIDVEDVLNLDEEGRNFFYVAIEHPIPLVPNVRLQSTDISTKGTGEFTAGTIFGDETFTISEAVSTEVDLSHTDATLYYEILDNWVNLDLGLTLRMFDGEGKVIGATSGTTDKVTVDEAAPMLYAAARFDLPLTGLSVGADINGLGYSGNTLTDFTAKISYTSDIVPFVDIGVEAGYRQMQLVLDDIGDLETDFSIAGPYFSLNFHL
jgi:outer membrane protein